MKYFVLSTVTALGLAAASMSGAQQAPDPATAPDMAKEGMAQKGMAGDNTRQVVSYGGVIDMNGNQTFSIEEVATAYPGITVKAYNAIDTDDSGEWNTAELAAARKKGILPQ